MLPVGGENWRPAGNVGVTFMPHFRWNRLSKEESLAVWPCSSRTCTRTRMVAQFGGGPRCRMIYPQHRARPVNGSHVDADGTPHPRAISLSSAFLVAATVKSSG